MTNPLAYPTINHLPTRHERHKHQSKFCFLAEHDPLFLQLASSAERNFTTDPNTTLVKVRQLGEALAQDIATRLGVAFDNNIKQVDLINLLHK